MAVLVTRSIFGTVVVDRLVADPEDRSAAEQTWTIGTSLLRDTTVVVLIVGLSMIFAPMAPLPLATTRGAPPFS